MRRRERAACFKDGGGNLASNGSVSFMFKHMGVFRLNPAGIDAEALELDLIDHGLEEMGEGASDKGEPQLVLRCEFNAFGKLQKAIEDRGITPLSAESSTSRRRGDAARGRRPKC